MVSDYDKIAQSVKRKLRLIGVGIFSYLYSRKLMVMAVCQ